MDQTGDESFHAEFKQVARLSASLTSSHLEGLFQCWATS